MPTTRDIRRRIKSVKNTAQITKAMQMVAAAKMRKAQQAALAGRPYATLMNEVLAEATARAGDGEPPRLELDEPDLPAYLGRLRFFSEIAERTSVPGVATELPGGGKLT